MERIVDFRPQKKQKKKFNYPLSKVGGYEGLVASIIVMATRDYWTGDDNDYFDAWEYFNGPNYIAHLDFLDLQIHLHNNTAQ